MLFSRIYNVKMIVVNRNKALIHSSNLEMSTFLSLLIAWILVYITDDNPCLSNSYRLQRGEIHWNDLFSLWKILSLPHMFTNNITLSLTPFDWDDSKHKTRICQSSASTWPKGFDREDSANKNNAASNGRVRNMRKKLNWIVWDVKIHQRPVSSHDSVGLLLHFYSLNFSVFHWFVTRPDI